MAQSPVFEKANARHFAARSTILFRKPWRGFAQSKANMPSNMTRRESIRRASIRRALDIRD
jgi:hypothetical protein